MKVIRKILHVCMNYKREMWFVMIGFISFCISCELTTEEDTTKIFKELEEDQKSITQHIEDDPDNFSILYDIMDTTGLGHLFRTYGDYTFLAPVNSAFEEYFAENGKTSYKEFDVDELRELIKYHIFPLRFLAGTLNDGIIESKTLTLDYMVSGPSSDGSNILFNKESKIIAQDMLSANGIIHTVDKVIKKPVPTIYEWLSAQKNNYSIIVEALEKTGLDKLTNSIINENGGDEFFTCFITPDSIYEKSNIKSFDDLAQIISPNNNNYTDSSNAMFTFIGSHFLTDILSTSDATDEHVFYGTVGGATIKFGLIPSSADVVLNYKTIDFPNGLNINEFYSNNLTKNGIIHLMDTMYQVTKSFERTTRTFIYLDVPGFPYDSIFDFGVSLYEEQDIMPKCGDNTDKSEEMQAYGCWAQFWPRPESGLIHIPFERTNGWLTLNSPYSGQIRTDHHRVNESWEWNNQSHKPLFLTFEACDDLLDITRKIPYIIPGKYRLLLETKVGPSRPSIKNYFDGKPVGGIVSLETGGFDFQDLDLGVLEIKEDENEHYIRTQTVTTGKGFFVAIKFVPVD